MLFLWSREPSATSNSPRAGPWFAWFATAVLLWRCRHRIARALADAGSVLQLGLLRCRRSQPHRTASLLVSKTHHHKHRHRHRRLEHQHRPPSSAPAASSRRRRSSQQLHPVCQTQQHIGDKPVPRCQQPRLKVRRRPKNRVTVAEVPRRLGVSASCVQISQQLYCRVTRSGRVYGRYSIKPPPIK